MKKNKKEKARKKYLEKKEEIREQAIAFSFSFYDRSYSYEELADATNYLEKQAKKYGLLKEFRENGII